MEELSVEEISLEGSGQEADPYMEAIRTDLLKIEDHDEIGSLDLDLLAVSGADRIATVDDLQKQGAVKATRIGSDISTPAIMSFPDPEHGSIDPFMTTGFAFLLPVALLLALVAFIRRIGSLSGNGSKAEFVALFMGMAGLAALAVI